VQLYSRDCTCKIKDKTGCAIVFLLVRTQVIADKPARSDRFAGGNFREIRRRKCRTELTNINEQIIRTEELLSVCSK
jgi:hypothetical protein